MTRTAPPHSSPVSAPAIVRAADRPAEAEGDRKPARTQSEKVRSTKRTTGSASRSGA